MTASINTVSIDTAFINTASAAAAQTYTVTASPVAAVTARKARLLRQLSLKWDLYGVVTLMASSTAYGLFALAHAV